jgi:bifunctional ADP-heptose synthase (sugar kinase/adenylyltransferase)
MHLEAASRLGELWVSVTADAFVNKGPGRPIFPAAERADIIHFLSFVSGVFITNGLIEALEMIKPDILVKGNEYKGKIEKKHLAYCKKHKIKIVFTDEPVYSSTKIINGLGSRK